MQPTSPVEASLSVERPPVPTGPLAQVNGFVIAALYMFLSLGWMVVAGLLMAVLLFAGLAMSGGDPLSAATMGTDDIPAWVVGASTIVQFAGMFGLAALLAALTRRRAGVAFGWASWGSPAALVAGAVGGFTVGFFPGFVAQLILEHVPWLSFGNLTAIQQLMVDGSLVARLPLLIAVCLIAPVVEELVFRGFLYDAIGRSAPPWVAWVATSALFAVYHLDPVHVIAVFFTGLFLGWLRWQSGSVVPSILAHTANNTLAATLATTFGGETTDMTAQGALAVVGLALTSALAALAWWGRRAGSPIEA